MITQGLTIFKDAMVKDLFGDKFKRRILCFNAKESTGLVLKGLEQESILSCPLVNDQNKVVGVADLQKIMLFAVGLHPAIEKQPEPQGAVAEALSKLEKKSVLGEKFESTPIGEVIEGVDAFDSAIPRIFKVTPETPMEKLLEMFYLGVHRVLVVDKDDKMISQISQTDLLEAMAYCLPFFDPKVLEATIEGLKLLDGRPAVVSVPEDMLVLRAMNLMVMNQISSVPVVDTSGVLTMVLSSSNIRGLNAYTFGELATLSVKQYLEKQAKNVVAEHGYSATHLRTVAMRGLTPVTVGTEATFQSIVTLMRSTKVHRLFVVDKSKKVLGVISLGDLFQIFLPWGAPQKFQ